MPLQLGRQQIKWQFTQRAEVAFCSISRSRCTSFLRWHADSAPHSTIYSGLSGKRALQASAARLQLSLIRGGAVVTNTIEPRRQPLCKESGSVYCEQRKQLIDRQDGPPISKAFSNLAARLHAASITKWSVMALVLAVTISCTSFVLPPCASAFTHQPSYGDLARLHHKRSHSSALPNAKEAETLAELNRDMFTDEAYLGMLEIIKYARYVEDQHATLETADGCQNCESNRVTLERAWQVVANEFFDPSRRFRQDAWARTLLATLQDSGGVLSTKHELHQAAHRMIASLGDPYSEWLPPSEFRRALSKVNAAERKYLALQMTGVGVAVGRHDPMGGWLVEAPMAGSPAEHSGIIRGDRILQIDEYDVDAQSLTRDEVIALLRGPAGSLVQLLVGTNAAAAAEGAAAREVTLERRSLPQPPLHEARLPMSDGREAAVIRIHYFASETRRAVQTALLHGEIDGVDGYILDLRNNPGGVFEDAIAIASMLLNEGLSVATTVRTAEGFVDNSFRVGNLSKEIFLNLPGTLTRAPIVILTNAATASASEVLAGALHDNGRAVLIGEQTFGKGVVQYYFPVHGDGGLKLTVAKYLTPKHDITEAGGLLPDLACSDFPHAGPPSAETDRCLAAAVEHLNQQEGPIELPTLYARAEQSIG